MSRKVDFIIVGQGLAGTTFAHTIEQTNSSYLIIDNCDKHTSSFAAAGIFHPFSFKRLLLSWKSDIFIPFAFQFYQSIEKALDTTLLSKQPMYRIFSSVEEQNNWHAKQSILPYSKFIHQQEPVIRSVGKLKSPFGIGKVGACGRLDVSKYIHKSRNYFSSKETLLKSNFDYKKLVQCKNEFNYENTTASRIVFCEGPKFTENPYFNYLPHNACKGEIILIESRKFPEELINKGCFVFPLGENKFIIGSTYNHKEINHKCSEDGKTELIKKFSAIGDFDYTIVGQKAGVRPTTKDRRPLMGEHPELKNMFILNGFGSKGVMMAPYLSNQLNNHIQKNVNIFPEANIARYSKKHFKSVLLPI